MRDGDAVGWSGTAPSMNSSGMLPSNDRGASGRFPSGPFCINLSYLLRAVGDATLTFVT